MAKAELFFFPLLNVFTPDFLQAIHIGLYLLLCPCTSPALAHCTLAILARAFVLTVSSLRNVLFLIFA